MVRPLIGQTVDVLAFMNVNLEYAAPRWPGF